MSLYIYSYMAPLHPCEGYSRDATMIFISHFTNTVRQGGERSVYGYVMSSWQCGTESKSVPCSLFCLRKSQLPLSSKTKPPLLTPFGKLSTDMPHEENHFPLSGCNIFFYIGDVVFLKKDLIHHVTASAVTWRKLEKSF